MNDRFKFRFYDKQCKMYLSDGYYINGNKWMGDYYEDVYDLPENIIPEQCTGLKDKNGNLIYEGDVVKCDRDFSENGRKNLIRKVIFADGSFQLERANTIGDRYYINAFHNFEIIGNIHEQAEQKERK